MWRFAVKALQAGIGVLLAAGPVSGATTGDVTVTVTVQSLSLAVTSNGTWAVGTVSAGSTTTQTGAQRAVVQNNGNSTERFTLQLSNAGGTWSVSTDQTAGADECVMNGIFAATGDSIVTGDFNTSTGNEDIITGAPASASATVYATAAGSANGASVPAGQSRGLWLQLKAPTSSSTAAQQSLTTTIGVEAAP